MVLRTRQEILQAFDALDAALSRCAELSVDALNTVERFEVLERCERVRRRVPAIEHGVINRLGREATAEELGGQLSHALAEWVLVSRAEAARRIREAADLGARHGLRGEPLPARLAATSAAQRAGKIGAEHVAVIRRFCQQLPGWVDEATRDRAEAQLARQGGQFRPDQLAKLADKLADCLNPDGTFTDEDRARRRGLTLGKQDIDGMSPIRGWLTPEARATMEAVLAKLAAPGMCNAADETPCVDGTPSQQAVEHDTHVTMTGCLPGCGRCWPAENWASTMGYRQPSWSRPPSKSWKPAPAPG